MTTNTENWSEANQRGHDIAQQTIDIMREAMSPLYLGQVLREMIERGCYGGVEVGFCHAIAVMLLRQW